MTKLTSWLPVILWMAIIYIFSSFDAAVVSSFDLVEFAIKKIIHLIEYGILWGLIFRALQVQTGRQSARTSAWLALLITIIYAAGDEFHQTFNPTRHGTFRDVIIDTAGAAIAYFLTFKISKPKHDT
jgi:VanZ family protein